MLSLHQLVCRYDYRWGLSEGISDLVGRDQAVANALKQMSRFTNLELFLAFVSMEETGEHHMMLMCLAFQGADGDLFWHGE